MKLKSALIDLGTQCMQIPYTGHVLTIESAAHILVTTNKGFELGTKYDVLYKFYKISRNQMVHDRNTYMMCYINISYKFQNSSIYI